MEVAAGNQAALTALQRGLDRGKRLELVEVGMEGQLEIAGVAAPQDFLLLVMDVAEQVPALALRRRAAEEVADVPVDAAIAIDADGIGVEASQDDGAASVRQRVAAGLTATDMLEEAFGSRENYQASATRHPLGRTALPGEIVDLMVYLLSDEASFQTGGAYRADGGALLV